MRVRTDRISMANPGQARTSLVGRPMAHTSSARQHLQEILTSAIGNLFKQVYRQTSACRKGSGDRPSWPKIPYPGGR